MSVSQILEEISRLPADERRRIARHIYQMEDEAGLLGHYSRLADEQFLELDRMEEEDGSGKAR